MIDSFLAPQRLWLLLAVGALAAVYVAMQLRQKTYAVRFSNTHLLDKVAPKRPGWRRHLVASGFLAALAIVVVAGAQPQGTVLVPRERATVILAIDTSLSMDATDVSPSRIEAAKIAADEFIDALPDSLRLGLVSFDKYSRLVVPPTTDRQVVATAVDNLELGPGTAIGDAVGVSLDAISNIPLDESGEPIPGVVVLLSDGKTTEGMATENAIPMAVEADVPIWTIAYGTASGTIDVADGSGRRQRISVPVDPVALGQLAEGTDGRAFAAESADDLGEVYQQMGSSIGYTEEDEDITWKISLLAAGLLALVSIFSLAWFQRLP